MGQAAAGGTCRLECRKFLMITCPSSAGTTSWGVRRGWFVRDDASGSMEL